MDAELARLLNDKSFVAFRQKWDIEDEESDALIPPDYLADLGRICVQFASLENGIVRVISTFLLADDKLVALFLDSVPYVRRIEVLEQVLKKAAPAELEDWILVLGRAKEIGKLRNQTIHNPWGIHVRFDENGGRSETPIRFNRNQKSSSTYEPGELRALADAISELGRAMNVLLYPHLLRCQAKGILPPNYIITDKDIDLGALGHTAT